MWYAVANRNGRSEKLTQARVAFTEVIIEEPRRLKVLAFPDGEMARALEVLGLHGKNLTKVTTNNRAVTFLEEQAEAKEKEKEGSKAGKVMLESPYNMEHWDEIEPVLREFAATLGVEMRVSNPHGNHSEPVTADGLLYIRFWSTPEYAARCKYPQVFGIRTDERAQSDGCVPSGQGIPITDPDGTVVAEVVGGTLYVLFDLPHGANAGSLMRAIMEQYLLLQQPAERNRLVGELRERENRQSREAYVRECGRRIQRMREQTTNEIGEVEHGLNSASRTIVELTRRLEGLRMKSTQLAESGRTVEARFAMEYDKLLQVPHVRRVQVRDGVVSVFTDTVYLEYNGDRYELGDYRIDIYTDGNLRIVNLRVRELTGQTKYQHPHVFREDGSNVCLGNITEGIAKLIGAYEYSVAAQILIEFLHTMTKTGDYPHYLTSNWEPVTAPETAEATR